MTIMLGITKKGFKDICIVGNNCKEGKEYIDLYHLIEPEIAAFEGIINEKMKNKGYCFRQDDEKGTNTRP